MLLCESMQDGVGLEVSQVPFFVSVKSFNSTFFGIPQAFVYES